MKDISKMTQDECIEFRTHISISDAELGYKEELYIQVENRLRELDRESALVEMSEFEGVE